MYVADTARINEFTAGGGFVRAWGHDVDPAGGTGFETCTTTSGCQLGDFTGDGPGALMFGRGGVDVAADGTVWSGDWHERVSSFVPGAPVGFGLSFGFDVVPGGATGFESCTAGTGCKAGVAGGGVGQFNGIHALAIDCRGGIWEADGGNDRITRFTEPGTPAATTCTDPAVPPAKPSNAFTIGKAKLNKKKGTATIGVVTPGSGALSLFGQAVKAAAATAAAAGEVELDVKPAGKAKKKLKRKGKAKVAATVFFAPTGGDLAAKTANVKLKRTRP